MPLPLPDLDTRRFDDLVSEMRALIPQLAPDWTNHNISDPGITLVELMAWVVEVNLYRANRVAARTTVNFISLLLGESSVQSDPFRRAMGGVTTADIEREAARVSAEIDQVFVRYGARENRVSVSVVLRVGAAQAADIIHAAQLRLGALWLSGPQLVVESLDAARQRALRFFNDPYRAVTVADFEREALRASAAVRRVRVSSFPDLGTVSVAVVPASGGLPDAPLLAAVAQRLDERKLVGTRVVVRPPQYTRVELNVALAVRPNTVEQSVLQAATAAVTGFFDPLRGGPGLAGWPFGRPVSIYEIYRLIEAVPGVDHVDRIELNGDPDTREVPVQDLPVLQSLVITAVNGS
jgi:phage-related baseplate assembly protein